LSGAAQNPSECSSFEWTADGVEFFQWSLFFPAFDPVQRSGIAPSVKELTGLL
jgi:hypothetical protein